MESRGGMSSLTRGHNRCKGTEAGIYLAALRDSKGAGGVEANEQQEGEKKGGRVVTGAMQGLGIKRSHGVLRARKRSNLE